jgi:hypothetical protein
MIFKKSHFKDSSDMFFGVIAVSNGYGLGKVLTRTQMRASMRTSLSLFLIEITVVQTANGTGPNTDSVIFTVYSVNCFD